MIWLILVIATIVRLIKLDQSLWLDEAISVNTASNLSFSKILEFSKGDFHPPGHYLLLKIWIILFGSGEIAVRSLSVLFAILTIFFVYLISKNLFNNKIAIISSFLLALAPLHIYYSQEARMYSMATFAVAASFYFLYKIRSQDLRYYLGYIISLVLIFYSDYLVYSIIPAQLLFIMLFRKINLIRVLLSILGSLVLTLPVLILFPQQLLAGVHTTHDLVAWSKIVGGASAKNLGLLFVKTILGRISIENKIIYGLVSIASGVIYLVIIFAGLRKVDEKKWLLVIWMCFPIGLIFIISFFVPVFSYQRMLFILPAFYILLALGVDNLTKKLKYLAFLSLILISVISLFIYYLNPKFQREDWRDATRFVNIADQPSTQILFEDNHLPPPFIYYSKSLANAKPGLQSIPARTMLDLSVGNTIENNIKTVYLFDYLVEITDPDRLLSRHIQLNNFKSIKTYDFPGVGFVTEFKRI